MTYVTLWTWNGIGSIPVLTKLNFFQLTFLVTGAFDVKMDGYVLDEKSVFKIIGLSLSSTIMVIVF